MEHDNRFKQLLEEFFVLFMQLFFPDIADKLDFPTLSWLPTESRSDPGEGSRKYLDLVAQVSFKEPPVSQAPSADNVWLAVVHMEIEADDKTTRLGPRFPYYYLRLREKYRLPVLPIVLYARVGLDGIGVEECIERFADLEVMRFRHLYVGLPALSAEHYLNQDNVLGIALSALMHIESDRKAWLKAEALRRLLQCKENDRRRFLLCECVQAYLPLEGPQLEEFNHLLGTDYFKELKAMSTTWYEQGLDQGQRRVLNRLLQKRFGPLSPQVSSQLQAWPTDKLEELAEAILQAQSLRDLGLEGDVEQN